MSVGAGREDTRVVMFGVLIAIQGEQGVSVAVLAIVAYFLGDALCSATKLAAHREEIRLMAGTLGILTAAYLFVSHTAGIDPDPVMRLFLSFIAFLVTGSFWYLGVAMIASAFIHVIHPVFRAGEQVWRRSAGRLSQWRERQQRKREWDAYERGRRSGPEMWPRMRRLEKRREDARASCEFLYSLHAPELAARFNRSEFDDFLRKYMGDDRAAEHVEQRAEQLRDIIQKHVDRADPPKKPPNLADLARWYLEKKQEIEQIPIGQADKELLLGQLEERYVRLQEKYLRAMQP